MPLLDRDTVIDRPVLLERGNEESEDGQAQVQTVETLGDGGGPILNSIEFRPGDFDIVAASNAAAVLATGEDEGEEFERSFQNAAFQLFELKETEEDITDIVRFSLEKGISDIGLSEEQISELQNEPEEESEDLDSDDDNEDDSEVEQESIDVEDEIEEMKENGEETS